MTAFGVCIVMAKIRISKDFEFEMAHALWNYDGLCKNIHGHSYKLRVTLIGTPVLDESNPKLGMVMDFGELKQIVLDEVVDRLDHTLLIFKKAPAEKLAGLPQMTERFEITDYQPTCENLLIDFAERIKKRLPDQVLLLSMRLYETSTSFAEWFAEDN